jgi:ABC-2 type transport system permease protein
MTSNTTLIEVEDRGWLNGIGALWRKENHSWWGTRSWLVKMIIWVVVLDGMLAMVAFQPETGEVNEPLTQTALSMYFLLAGLLPTFGVIILGQDAVIQERQTGTAAWVLSKPVSRAAFLLSKLCAYALEILVTMVLMQGLIAYFICKAITGISLSTLGFLAGLGLVYLFLLSFLVLILMLGTLFRSRGPLLGISMPFISVNTLAAAAAPGLSKVMPVSMLYDFGSGQIALTAALSQRQPLPTLAPIFITALLVIIFTIIALVRFERVEF